LKPLKPIPQCIDCLTRLTRNATVLATGGAAKFIRKAEKEAGKLFEQARDQGLSSPELANLILRTVRRLSGVGDPYAPFKAREMRRAREIFGSLEGSASGDLRDLVRIAVLGNSLDFFTDPEEVLAEVSSRLEEQFAFYYDDIERLETFVEGYPGLILYLTDNAGEVYFDLPLFNYLNARAKRTVLVVKGGPALNDLTRAELESTGLRKRFAEVADTGTEGAGIAWKAVSKAFLALVEEADLILSKGMANFETIYPVTIPPAVFFLLKVKCKPVQDYVKAPQGSFLALWRDGNAGRNGVSTANPQQAECNQGE
jgi:uncharacterized protein with ATP-grasp and redox domains